MKKKIFLAITLLATIFFSSCNTSSDIKAKIPGVTQEICIYDADAAYLLKPGDTILIHQKRLIRDGNEVSYMWSIDNTTKKDTVVVSRNDKCIIYNEYRLAVIKKIE